LIQRLNLVPPDPEPASSSSQGAASFALPPGFPEPDQEAVNEVLRRQANLIKERQFPALLFACLSDGGVVLLPGENRKTILLFTSRHAAQDYIRVFGLNATVGALKLTHLSEEGKRWVAAGVEAFTLNRCPRCNVLVSGGAATLLDQEEFGNFWAISRATQLYCGEIKVREYIGQRNTDPGPAQSTLEYIRDHIDCSIPYLHELIAFTGRLNGDEMARATSVERLTEFGPEFANWEERWKASDPVASARSHSAALVGLAQNFGLRLVNKTS
jgi:hypothetical protein